MKNKKIIYILVSILSIMMVSSCFQKQEEPTYTNEIITQKVEYEENINIFDLEDAIVHAIDKCDNSVVGITCENLLSSNFGSGVIFDYEDHGTYYTYFVLTNFHVISTNDRISGSISVYLGNDDELLTAQALESNKNKDLAIISFKTPRLLTVASIGDSTTLQKGRYAIAVGNPYELKTYYNTATVGYISHPNRVVYEKSNLTNYYIQHTAQINSGNSGGGLFNLQGELIGINSWKYAVEEIEGMGFAIPIHIVKLTFPSYFK